MPNRPQKQIPEIPGFDPFFLKWLDDRFRGIENDVSDLVECVATGNGKPSLKSQVERNTEFRESVNDERRDAKNARRTAFWTAAVSFLLLVANIVWSLARSIPTVAGGG